MSVSLGPTSRIRRCYRILSGKWQARSGLGESHLGGIVSRDGRPTHRVPSWGLTPSPVESKGLGCVLVQGVGPSPRPGQSTPDAGPELAGPLRPRRPWGRGRVWSPASAHLPPSGPVGGATAQGQFSEPEAGHPEPLSQEAGPVPGPPEMLEPGGDCSGESGFRPTGSDTLGPARSAPGEPTRHRYKCWRLLLVYLIPDHVVHCHHVALRSSNHAITVLTEKSVLCASPGDVPLGGVRKAPKCPGDDRTLQVKSEGS